MFDFVKCKLFYNTPMVVLFLILFLFSGCGGNRIERETGSPGMTIPRYNPEGVPYLKLHMKNGDLYLMNSWNLDSGKVTGKGQLYDYNRTLKKVDDFKIPIKDIVIAETNSIKAAAGTSIMLIPTIAAGIFGIVCLVNPKACFGSCPTFYTNNGRDYQIQAEGFSSSVSSCLEENDVDALYNYKAVSNNLEILLKNEAYETHFIRNADILALPREQGNRVLAAEDGGFYEVNCFTNPNSILGEEGDCSENLCSFDGEERFSSADSSYLASKESIVLTFDNVSPGKKGLVITSRQSLLMTYIFYQGLAYMGTMAGDYYSKLERDTTTWKNLMRNTRGVLGRIEVYVGNSDNTWQKVGESGEFGPIASDIKIVPFNIKDHIPTLKIKLKMTKGFWRIDYLSMVNILNPVNPIRISPSEAYPEIDRKGSGIVAILNDDDSLLVTLPGDNYLLHYRLPDDYNNYELFLESRGYYMEWMRKEWMDEENPVMVYKMFFNPQQYFKDLAPLYKKIEAGMEETFWSSKYVNP